jgi:hypothetical protein
MWTEDGWPTRQTRNAWVEVSNDVAVWEITVRAALDLVRLRRVEDKNELQEMVEIALDTSYREGLYSWLVDAKGWESGDLMFVDVTAILNTAHAQIMRQPDTEGNT